VNLGVEVFPVVKQLCEVVHHVLQL
jgi:hypothetical protein